MVDTNHFVDAQEASDYSRARMKTQAFENTKKDRLFMYKHGYYNYNMSAVDEMDGHEFEHFCADLLQKNGFSNVRVTPGSGDQGVDVIASKDGIKYAIQCKNYASALSNTPVQEVTAGKQFYGCHVGVVMTNSTFTPGAIQLATATNVLLWDRSKLHELIEKAGGLESLGLSSQTHNENYIDTNDFDDGLYDLDDEDEAEAENDIKIEEEPQPRKGMKIASKICLGWSVVCGLMSILVNIFSGLLEQKGLAGICLGEGVFVLILGIMLRVIANTEKGDPYIYFGDKSIRKPIFVIICIVIAYALLFVMMNMTGGLDYISS